MGKGKKIKLVGRFRESEKRIKEELSKLSESDDEQNQFQKMSLEIRLDQIKRQKEMHHQAAWTFYKNNPKFMGGRKKGRKTRW